MLKLGAKLMLGLMVLWSSATSTALGQVGLDPNLPTYRPVNNLQGELKLSGSSTMSSVAAVWASSFRQFYPNVQITIDSTGSRNAVQAVEDFDAHIGLLSRTITQEEIDSFVRVHRHTPQVLTPCLERMAVYVHKDNPIRGLTISQVDAIFGEDCKWGAEKPVRTWGQLGFPGAWEKQPVIAQGRSADTGSQVYWHDVVLRNGAFRADLKENESNLDMMKAIGADPRSVGFAGLSYATHEVRAVPLAITPEGPFVSIDSPEADAGQYLLMRPLQLVVDHDPQIELPAIQKEFIRYVFSNRGQEDVIKAGFHAISAKPAHIALDQVGLESAR